MKTISKAMLLALITTSCGNSKLINPIKEPTSPISPITPTTIKIDYVVRINHTDTSKVTNLVNGLGYAHKVNGNWINVDKFRYAGSFKPVVAGNFFRGQFIIPSGLSDLNFRSQLFLLSTNSGDPLVNSQNEATIQVWANNVLIVDKTPTGFDSISWNYGRYDIGALVPLTY